MDGIYENLTSIACSINPWTHCLMGDSATCAGHAFHSLSGLLAVAFTDFA